MSYRIGFSRSALAVPWLSDLIRKIEKRPYSHAYVRMTDPYNARDVVFQATGAGVNKCNFDIFTGHNLPVKEYEINCTEAEFKEIWTWLSDKLGIPYSRMQIFWIFVKKVFRVSGKTRNGDGEFICSELAAKTLKIKGIQLPKYEDEITPSDLDKLLQSYGFSLVPIS